MAAPTTALSTSFFPVRRESDGEKLLSVIRDLPVSGIEFDYRLPAPVYHRIRPLLRTTGIQVVSVHNFFPLPLEYLKAGGSGDLFSLSDLRREERQEAVRRTLHTIDHAHDLEARAVVLHCGWVDMEADTERLYRDVQKNGALTEETRQWLAKKTAERDRLKPAHLDALRFSLDKLLHAADKRSLCLGLETRYHYHELPAPDDFEGLLEEFAGAPLGYWHDTGHAFINEQLELTAAGELMARLSSRLAGIHLHDARGLEDHLPPGTGRIDFPALAPRLAAGIPAVLELQPGTPQAAVRAGLEHLRSLFQKGRQRSEVRETAPPLASRKAGTD